AALRGAADVVPLEAGIKQAASVMAAALEVNHAYVTLFHCTFDVRSGDLEYVDAGHGHARLLRGVTSQELLGERSAPIGIFPESKGGGPAGEAGLPRATRRGGDVGRIYSGRLLARAPIRHQAWHAAEGAPRGRPASPAIRLRRLKRLSPPIDFASCAPSIPPG